MLSDLGLVGAVCYVGIAFLFGLIFGSAINAIVWRVYVGRSWMRGRSQCPDCGHELAARDLVPVFSWLALRGKCRYCGAPIKDHPIVELVTGATFAFAALALLPAGVVGLVRLGFMVFILVMLVALAVYDQRWLILPDKLMLPLIGVTFVYTVVMAVMERAPRVLEGSLLAALLAGGAFFALVYFSKGRAMGGGDIKLAFAMGLLLGLQGTGVALLLAFNAAAIIGVTMIVLRKRKRNDHIPFGPFLVAGAVIAFVLGRQLLALYLNWTGMV
jgi:prepilin signal peptidase PulO-like enzyme (type II secretory pathway)